MRKRGHLGTKPSFYQNGHLFQNPLKVNGQYWLHKNIFYPPKKIQEIIIGFDIDDFYGVDNCYKCTLKSLSLSAQLKLGQKFV